MKLSNFNHFSLLICSIISFFVFCFLVILNRIVFILENPNFVFRQEEPIRKWFQLSNELINFVTFAPLFFSIIFLIIFIYLKLGSRKTR